MNDRLTILDDGRITSTEDAEYRTEDFIREQQYQQLRESDDIIHELQWEKRMLMFHGNMEWFQIGMKLALGASLGFAPLAMLVYLIVDMWLLRL